MEAGEAEVYSEGMTEGSSEVGNDSGRKWASLVVSRMVQRQLVREGKAVVVARREDSVSVRSGVTALESIVAGGGRRCCVWKGGW